MQQPLFDVPCIPIKKSVPLTIRLPIGAELRTLTNIADGPPTDCALAQSLMLQITPVLASMACLLKMLKVISALKTTAESGFLKAGDLISAIEGMTDCLGIVLAPIPICKMVKDILLLVISYLNCMIEAVDSVLEFHAGVDLSAANGNPVLLASLECAQNNAQTSMDALNDAMVGIQPILEMVNMALSIVGVNPISPPPMGAQSPSLKDLAGQDPLKPFKDVVQALQTAAQALPC